MLTGPWPASVTSRLRNMYEIRMVNMRLNGSLPSSLPPNLRTLTLSRLNSLTGGQQEEPSTTASARLPTEPH